MSYLIVFAGCKSTSDGTNTYPYGNGRIGEYGTSGWAYHHADALGSVRLLTNGVGNVRGSASYTPFGEVMGTTAGSAFGFAGEQTDATGLQYLRARYYAPEMGRFLTTDPYAGRQAVPYSLHPYQYGYSNPLGYVDPDGKHACLAALGLAVVDGPSPVGDAIGIVACATQLAADVTALTLGTYAVTHPPEAAPITPENPDPAADVESFPLDAGIELPIYTPPGQVDNWWDDGLDATPIDELVELHPEGISVEIPNIEVDIFPLWQEEEEQLFCAETGLTNEAQAAIERLENILADPIGVINSTPGHNHYDAARREARGQVVAWRQDGRPFSHIGELQEAWNGLDRVRRTLEYEMTFRSEGLTERGEDILLRRLRQVVSHIQRLGDFLRGLGFPPPYGNGPGETPIHQFPAGP